MAGYFISARLGGIFLVKNLQKSPLHLQRLAATQTRLSPPTLRFLFRLLGHYIGQGTHSGAYTHRYHALDTGLHLLGYTRDAYIMATKAIKRVLVLHG